MVGARSVLPREVDGWFQAAKRRDHGARGGVPRRKRALVAVGSDHGSVTVAGTGCGCRSPRAVPRCGCGWPVPAVASPAGPGGEAAGRGGRLWLAVTAAVAVHPHQLDPGGVAGVDLGSIHPARWSPSTPGWGCRAGRAARSGCCTCSTSSHAAPRPHRARRQPLAAVAAASSSGAGCQARHRRRVHQAHHHAATQVVALAVQQRVGTLLVGDPKASTQPNAGRVHTRRCGSGGAPTCCTRCGQGGTGGDRRAAGGRAWQLLHRPRVPAAGAQPQRPPRWLPARWVTGHRDLPGARNLAAKHGGRPTSTAVAVRVEHRGAGVVPARRDRRRHLHHHRRRSCLAAGLPAAAAAGCRWPDAHTNPAAGEDQAASPNRANVA